MATLRLNERSETDLGLHRGELDCRRLVLTHMGRDMLDRVVDAERAEDGLTLTL